MLRPGLGGQLDHPDIAGLAAPTPMLFLCGRSDPHFPAAVTEAALGDLRRIWRAAGAGAALETGLVDAGHVFTAGHGARAFDFLERRLRAAASPDQRAGRMQR
ncbi:hypothetical protein [Amaricoccus sp.]|uniref:hypothetical protein n=1 Tax=Amaricoccus sp. TaxID=1872485 RepID=UPI001B420088|nr:hypothetical protein [Amaricoccus sp.]MBP7003643.1 hypothetical protein [Amaricoccus sp.]